MAELAKKSIPSPTGKSVWNRECIRKMLCNKKYAGAVLLQKIYVEDFFTGKQKKNVGQQERYFYKNNHEAVNQPRVEILCGNGRIPGAYRLGWVWAILSMP